MKIKKFASWNGFPKWVTRSVVTKAMHPHEHLEQQDVDSETIYLSLPYLGTHGEAIVRKTTKKLTKLMKREKNDQGVLGDDKIVLLHVEQGQDTIPEQFFGYL